MIQMISDILFSFHQFIFSFPPRFVLNDCDEK